MSKAPTLIEPVVALEDLPESVPSHSDPFSHRDAFGRERDAFDKRPGGVEKKEEEDIQPL